MEPKTCNDCIFVDICQPVEDECCEEFKDKSLLETIQQDEEITKEHE